MKSCRAFGESLSGSGLREDIRIHRSAAVHGADGALRDVVQRFGGVDNPFPAVELVGVFVDAFLVRMTIVPAIMSLLGERAWWLPRWLDRLLPDLDIEGEKLSTTLDTARHAAEQDSRPDQQEAAPAR